MFDREDLKTGSEIGASTAAGLAGAGAVNYGAQRLLNSKAFGNWRDGIRDEYLRDVDSYQSDVGERYSDMADRLTDGSTARGVLKDYGRGHLSRMKAPKWMVEDDLYEDLSDGWGRGNLRLADDYTRGVYSPFENKIVMDTLLFEPNVYLHELGHAADRASLVRGPDSIQGSLGKHWKSRAYLGAAGLALAGAGHDQEWAPALAAGGAAAGMWSPLSRSRELINEAKASYNGYRMGPMLEKRLSDSGYEDWKWDPRLYRKHMWNAYKTYLSVHAPRVLRAGGVLAGAAAVGAGARAGTREVSDAYRDVRERVYGRGW